MTKFGQIFYGRSRDGYGILGASPLGRPYVGFVAALCRAVGSPDRPGGIQPFLISKREGGNVIMIRACRGDADPTGRSTLFFHALVAPVDVLSPANLDAFVLAEKGVFLSTLSKSVDDFEVKLADNNTFKTGDPVRFDIVLVNDLLVRELYRLDERRAAFQLADVSPVLGFAASFLLDGSFRRRLLESPDCILQAQRLIGRISQDKGILSFFGDFLRQTGYLVSVKIHHIFPCMRSFGHCLPAGLLHSQSQFRGL